MSTGALDLLIHNPERLRVVATLAALPDGDALSVTRLQEMTGLTAASLTSRLRELDNGGYVRTENTGGDRPPPASLSPATAWPHWITTPPHAAAAPADQGGSPATSAAPARWRC
jgi:hypothetical protein